MFYLVVSIPLIAIGGPINHKIFEVCLMLFFVCKVDRLDRRSRKRKPTPKQEVKSNAEASPYKQKRVCVADNSVDLCDIPDQPSTAPCRSVQALASKSSGDPGILARPSTIPIEPSRHT